MQVVVAAPEALYERYIKTQSDNDHYWKAPCKSPNRTIPPLSSSGDFSPILTEMNRIPVTIAIDARQEWEAARECLDSLRPTLGVRDQVVVAVAAGGSRGDAVKRQFPWVEPYEQPADHGHLTYGPLLAGARHDLVVLLDSSTVLLHDWIRPLVRAFDDPSVGMAGPRFNFAAGPQMVSGAFYVTPADRRRYARQWSADNKGRVTDTDSLVPACVIVRRSLLGAPSSLEPAATPADVVAELGQRASAAGNRLVVCHESFLHASVPGPIGSAPGGEPTPGRKAPGPIPLVSACLIVKDEEENLPRCLRSLEAVADEVVVYDTGSTDRSAEIAEQAGARVIAGYWDDDFSRARNDALAHCRGEWVLWVDADETLETDSAEDLRTLLTRTKSEIDAWSVRIQNLTGSGAGSEFSHHAARLFRRSRCEWTGRLHEQIARRGDHSLIMQAELETGAWIRHTGYLDEVLKNRNKAERNLRVAQAEVDSADGMDKGYSLVSLGRSLLLSGQAEEALSKITEALQNTGNAITRRLGIRAAVDATVTLGRLDDALDWCDRLRAEGGDPNTADAMEATVRMALEEWDEVLALLGRVTPERSDADGFAPPAGLVCAQKAKALLAQGQFGAAADVLMLSLRESGVLDTHLGTLIECMQKAGRPMADLAAAIPKDREVLFLAQLLQLQPQPADELLEACLGAAYLDQMAVLATASKLATRLPIERALIWSFRLRQAGQSDPCPLIAIALGSADPLTRARAAAVARQSFGDQRADDAFIEVYGAAEPQERATIEAETAQLCPALLGLLGRGESVGASA